MRNRLHAPRCPTATSASPTRPPLRLSTAARTTRRRHVIDATPFTWTVASGTLPPGLSLSSGGAITGTPTATGTFNFTLRLVDSTGLTATQAQTITIAPGCAPPTTPTPPTPTPPPPPATPPPPPPPPAAGTSTVRVIKTWVRARGSTTIFVDRNGREPWDASARRRLHRRHDAPRRADLDEGPGRRDTAAGRLHRDDQLRRGATRLSRWPVPGHEPGDRRRDPRLQDRQHRAAGRPISRSPSERTDPSSGQERVSAL